MRFLVNVMAKESFDEVCEFGRYQGNSYQTRKGAGKEKVSFPVNMFYIDWPRRPACKEVDFVTGNSVGPELCLEH